MRADPLEDTTFEGMELTSVQELFGKRSTKTFRKALRRSHKRELIYNEKGELCMEDTYIMVDGEECVIHNLHPHLNGLWGDWAQTTTVSTPHCGADVAERALQFVLDRRKKQAQSVGSASEA